jgi:preprotein translocase subunit SecG
MPRINLLPWREQERKVRRREFLVAAGAALFASVILIVFILLHAGRGGGLSDMFGGGVSSGLGGSSVAERNLDRFTIGVGLVWIACIIALGLLLKK